MNEREISSVAKRLIATCRSRKLEILESTERLRSVPGSVSYLFAVDGDGVRTTVTVFSAGVVARIQPQGGRAALSLAPRGLTFEALAQWVASSVTSPSTLRRPVRMNPNDTTTTTPLAPVWSRHVLRADSLADFLVNNHLGHSDDPRGEATPREWLGKRSPCQGDGWDRNPLLAGSGADAAVMSGEIRDGRGWHPAARFARVEPFRTRGRR